MNKRRRVLVRLVCNCSHECVGVLDKHKGRVCYECPKCGVSCTIKEADVMPQTKMREIR